MSGQPFNLLIGLFDVAMTETPAGSIAGTGQFELPMILLAL